MAKLSTVERTQKKKKTVERYKVRREAALEKARRVFNDPSATMEDRMQASMEIQSKFPRNASKTRLRKICNKTGRPRGNNFTGISRIYLRKMIAEGLVPGVYKSSW